MNAKRCRRCVLLAVAAIAILAAVLNPWSLRRAAEWLDVGVGRPPRKADFVVLLNGGFNTRPFVAAALVDGGWAPKILLNTVSDSRDESDRAIPRTYEFCLKVIKYGGVSRDRVVVLDSAAKTTFDEAKGVADYLADHPAKRLMIVTDGPHTRRARWIFQRVLAGQPLEITMVSAPADEFQSANWWRCEAGFLFVVTEYFKLFYYGVRYGWLGFQMVGCVAVALLVYACFSWRRKLICSMSGLSP